MRKTSFEAPLTKAHALARYELSGYPEFRALGWLAVRSPYLDVCRFNMRRGVVLHDPSFIPPTSAAHVVWLMHTGVWPSAPYATRNGDPRDIRFENLVFADQVDASDLV